MKIVIVDDLLSDRLLVKAIINRSSLVVEEIREVEACADVIPICCEFDCVLIDQKLIGTQGVDCIVEIRRALFAGVLILLTGYTDDETLSRKALLNGADEFLLKGDLRVTLIPAVEKAMIVRAPGLKAYKDAKEREKTLNTLDKNLEALEGKLKEDKDSE